MTKNLKIGIIGGSGLENPEILENYKEIEVDTPFGKPSSKLTTGSLFGIDVVIISRHGKKHEIPPTQVNNRANIFALKYEGCKYIIGTTAVGSLKEEIKRGDFVILDQFIDFTRHKKNLLTRLRQKISVPPKATTIKLYMKNYTPAQHLCQDSQNRLVLF